MKHKPKSWSAIPNGDDVKNALNESISKMMPSMFGYHLAKLGTLAADFDTSDSPIIHQFSVKEVEPSNIIADFTHLPFEKKSIDCVISVLLLEFERNPFRILREINRVLISGGHLVIVGCNPLSSMVLGKMLPNKKQKFPWSGQFFSAHRVKDWLEVLGYQVLEEKRLVYHPLIGRYCENSLWQSWMESLLPFSGSFYVINAKKIECPLTPSRAWKRKRARNWSTAPTAGRISEFNSKESD
ncbi:SAM-dependent methyltransferase [Parashewanella spongiae]|uniref:SAM-dependent methyltransferase n=1 Tax=Parashewanella spongiae TaxID=342950 RepID=A0A3A6TLE2_9GAMM|nr:class I SAM-dependent methyltransferase [Parashewanella spongiae]MCL1078674.1 class I SAM-dependent methyltransferase [Parashewanella spongiae]RJY12953.1 SAM-dependent methyltransferase [Parashewanella spongiae]